ncbi:MULTISPECIES: DUF3023 domain-containing protein [Ehrlichia]|uniref:Uncharacterized protein n=1 Tax=Ehrlichia cf. muris str. EmCRT TaxID=1359167 RepID=A0A0F3NE62_9RICK|nr:MULTISPECIES: DUF3023 domain-containing protein [Ehrlichia]KJV66041.1 hypothetical protein EMUCRT_0231 [Ehrlichia cf. muris str. EmCRT]OUC04740.1 hypothetical protein DB91_00875 [Ehrlichia sp. Wisconsin_h]
MQNVKHEHEEKIKKFVNQHLCRKADNLSLLYEKCYCIGNTPENDNTLQIYLSKTYTSKKKIIPCGNSLFVLSIKYPIDVTTQLQHIHFLTLSQSAMQQSNINAKIYVFVKECNLRKFISNILNNNNKPLSTIIPSEYGNVIYTILYNNDFFEHFNEHNALSTTSKMIPIVTEYPTLKFIHKASIVSRSLSYVTCISQSNGSLNSLTTTH